MKGKDLIKLGYKSAPWFGKIIKELNEKNITKKSEIKKYIQNFLDSLPKEILPYQKPNPYFVNIEALDGLDEENIKSVIATMDEVMKTPTTVVGAIMPDACPSGDIGTIPVGGVVVTKNSIIPGMHSADICCSVMATNLGNIDPKKVLDIAFETTHFGPGGRKDTFELPAELLEQLKSNRLLYSNNILHIAKTHFGTQGDGNHFLFVGKLKSSGETYLVTHHGSRGVGGHLYKEGMKIAENFRQSLSPKTLKKNAFIPFDTPAGEQYWQALQIVREWTKQNHNILHQKICEKLGVEGKDRFWNEHNFVFKDGENFIHAKGATPLLEKYLPDSTNGLRLVPLNMGSSILIVKAENLHDESLGFAPHGAGRNLSRTQHKKTKDGLTVEQIFENETKNLDIRFFSKNIDISELPSAYKNPETIKTQITKFGLGKIVDEILPYGTIMAGDREKDAPRRNKKEK